MSDTTEPQVTEPTAEEKKEETTPASTGESTTASTESTFAPFSPAPAVAAETETPLLVNEIEVKTYEEDEEILVKLAAKLYRMAYECDPVEWKERGTGEIKLLKHKENGKIRILMRRDKTLKICANHYIHPLMKLEENVSSDRSWIYKTPQDFSDGSSGTAETLALRFRTVENAQQFKDAFLSAQKDMQKIMDEALAAGKDSA